MKLIRPFKKFKSRFLTHSLPSTPTELGSTFAKVPHICQFTASGICQVIRGKRKMLQSDDSLWRELRYRWGTASGTSRYIQHLSKLERSTADIWEDVYEDFCDGPRVWSAGIALLPHLTNLASMNIGTAKALHFLFAAAILLHCVTLDGGRIRNLAKVLPNGDVSPNRKLLSQMKCWVREAQVQGKTLIPHLFAIPRNKKRETDDLMLVLAAFDGFPSLIQLELPDIDDSE